MAMSIEQLKMAREQAEKLHDELYSWGEYDLAQTMKEASEKIGARVKRRIILWRDGREA